ncbi:MAG TPA: hypothetical protein VGF17_25650 [Phytomonospora sp.]
MSTYLYRCTEQQLEQHLQRIAEAGDSVEHVIYKGGRDYVLVCRKAESDLMQVVHSIAEDLRRLREAYEATRAKAVRS